MALIETIDIILIDMITVRPAKAEEWKVWKELRLQSLQDSPESFGEQYADAVKKTDDEWKNKMQEVATLSTTDTLFAIVEDQVVGMMYVFFRNDQQDTGGIGGLWVTPDNRQKGVGREMIDAALGWMKEKELQQVTFWNNKSNAASTKFYEKLGFTYTGIEKPLESDSNFIIGEMIKEL